MRCNQELYGHINCDRDVIAGEKYCKFHFVPFLRIKIEKLQAENSKLRECVEFYADATNNPKQYIRQGYLVYNLKKKIFVDGGERARQVLKELDNTK